MDVEQILAKYKVSREEYEERFCWHDGDITFSEPTTIPSKKEVDHAKHVLAKVIKTFEII